MLTSKLIWNHISIFISVHAPAHVLCTYNFAFIIACKTEISRWRENETHTYNDAIRNLLQMSKATPNICNDNDCETWQKEEKSVATCSNTTQVKTQQITEHSTRRWHFLTHLESHILGAMQSEYMKNHKSRGGLSETLLLHARPFTHTQTLNLTVCSSRKHPNMRGHARAHWMKAGCSFCFPHTRKESKV